MATIEHPLLGKIQGKSGDRVTQFLNIKYGFLGHRFGEPLLHDGAGSKSTIDATKLGPGAINAPDACEGEFALIQQKLPLAEAPPVSDTECLNLKITVLNSHSGGEKLPVLVFVHGGALATGSGNWPQYDCSALVKRSIELGTPFIGVTINYRTGIFGFLTSKEFREAGFKANNGLRDQKVAFQWIKKNIAGFGGDPDQVTAIGESAGAASLTLQLQSAEPLFQRLVAMSGTCLLLRPLPTFAHESFYQAFCEAQGLTNVSGSERIKAIEKMDSLTLFSNMPPGIPSAPLVDQDIIKTAPTYKSAESWSEGGDPSIPGLHWCKELVIGDCQMDGAIFQLALGHRQQGIAKALEMSLKRNIPNQDQDIDSLLSEYNISSSTSDSAAYQSVLELANDILFYLSGDAFARHFPGTTYVYHLNEPNPWDGPFKGQATHILDVALLFRNFDHELPAEAKEVGHAYGDSIIKFVSGQVPWQATSQSKPVAQVFGHDAGTGALRIDVSEKVGRRSTVFKYKDTIGWDTLNDAFGAFLAGR